MKETDKQHPAEFLKTKKIFFVGSTTDDTVLIAINPVFYEQTNILSWFDTVKERMKQVKSMQLGEDPMLQITDTQDNIYFFVPLSLPLYNNVVKNKLLAGKDFETEEDMVRAFEETMKYT